MNYQANIGRIHAYTKDLYEGKYHLLIDKRECSNDMDNIYGYIEEHNPNKSKKY